MSLGDAYIYAVVLKDYNVEEYRELMETVNAFNDIVGEECDNRRPKGGPLGMHGRMLYDLYLNNNPTQPMLDTMEKIECDNLAMSMVADDSWKEAYRACGKVKICKVKDFNKLVENKSWIPTYFHEYDENTMVTLRCHYDCRRDFLEGFEVKERRGR